MNRKTVSGIMVSLLLVGTLLLAFNIQPVRAIGTIYIRPDGSIDPLTAPIHRDGDLYTLADDVFSDTDGIAVERDNMTLDGADYSLQGSDFWPSVGVRLLERNNVTIKNLEIKHFFHGIDLRLCSNIDIHGNDIMNNNGYGITLDHSSNSNMTENSIGYNGDGVDIYNSSSNNSICGNNVVNNLENGISLLMSSSNNTVYGNSVTGNGHGFSLGYCPSNNITGNSIANSNYGLHLWESSNNCIYHNSFINNTEQAHDHAWDEPHLYSPSANTWDDGYPSGGNYWSDYNGTDLHLGPSQNITGSDGIGDEPYVISDYNQDNYPLMEPWSSIPTTIGDLKTEIEELGSEGEVDNQGIVTSLLAKLNVAQKMFEDGKTDQAKNILNAFINEVQAQSGKHITSEAADALIESAEYILSHL